MTGKFFGKHRGKVLDNIDPLMMGRIMADVPAVPGALLNWAMPCVPYAGPGVGFLALPPIGAAVWIEFEEGDPNAPIWVGGFWEQPEDMPTGPAVPERKIWKTEFITLTLDDTPEEGGLTFKVTEPVAPTVTTLSFDVEGVRLTAPDSTLQITPESISARVAPVEVSLSAEGIEVAIPPTRISVTGEAVVVGTPNIVVDTPDEVEGGA